MSTNINSAYQKGVGKIRDGLLICQLIDKNRNLDAFLASQQRIKSRENKAKTAQDCRSTATALSADIGCHNVAEANNE